MAAASIDEYLAGYPPKVRRVLCEIRRIVKRAAPAATERISYGIPCFRA